MGINISDLGPAAQAQALRKLRQQEAARSASANDGQMKKPSKYGNSPDNRGKIRFDSKKEARRYDELLVLLRAGSIRDLRLQPQYTLQEAYTTPEGERIRAIRYQADFSYERATAPDVAGVVHWIRVVEDVKSRATKTRAYEIKKKMLRDKFNVEVTEV